VKPSLITQYLYSLLGRAIRAVAATVEWRLKRWTKPARTNQVLSTVTDLSRSKAELIAENMFLRQQVIILEQQVTRPKLKPRDRQILVLLASWLPSWRAALMIVKPDTLIGWHRQGFRLYWRRKSRTRQGRPPIPAETIVLIEEMAVQNRTWRAKRIQGELLKLGIRVSIETIKKYMRRAQRGLPPRRRGQSWATFLANHAGETWAYDFVQAYDVFFRAIFVYFCSVAAPNGHKDGIN
jgi:putative transposase